MKKIALLSILALGFGFTACDNYEEPNPPAQSNPQESILKIEDVTVVNALSNPSEYTYSLQEYSESDTPIQVATITCATLPSAYQFATNV